MHTHAHHKLQPDQSIAYIVTLTHSPHNATLFIMTKRHSVTQEEEVPNRIQNRYAQMMQAIESSQSYIL